MTVNALSVACAGLVEIRVWILPSHVQGAPRAHVNTSPGEVFSWCPRKRLLRALRGMGCGAGLCRLAVQNTDEVAMEVVDGVCKIGGPSLLKADATSRTRFFLDLVLVGTWGVSVRLLVHIVPVHASSRLCIPSEATLGPWVVSRLTRQLCGTSRQPCGGLSLGRGTKLTTPPPPPNCRQHRYLSLKLVSPPHQMMWTSCV